MAQIFDRETLLDLTVNVIPLGIILVFVGLFVFTNPFPGLDRLGFLITLGLHIMPFVALALLTYVSGKAIAGDERREDLFFQGQATIDNAPTVEEARSSFDRHVSEEERNTEPAEETVGSDESATAEQEEEPAEHQSVEDATDEPAPPADVGEGNEGDDGSEPTDANVSETLDEQVESAGDESGADESAAAKGERAEGTVQDEATEATQKRKAEAGETEAESESDRAEAGSDQTEETATGDGEDAPTEADENAAPEGDEKSDDGRAE